MKIVDTHQHFWRFDPVEYDWIGPELAPLQRDFVPADLRALLTAHGDVETIAVEARGHIEETQALLEIAEREDFVVGVVGWLPLCERSLDELLDRFAPSGWLRGVRHAIGAEPDPDYMLREDFNRGITRLTARGLTYDLSFWPRELARAPRFVDAHPNQVFVLDHCAKPFIARGQMEPWRSEIVELARRPNVYCKLSGLATESSAERWQEQIGPYMEVVLEAFTPARLMFGSDWPVCGLATDYPTWLRAVECFVGELSEPEQRRIWAGTAREAYRLSR